MHTGGTAGQGDIRAVIDDDRDGYGGDQRATHIDEGPGIGVLEAQLDDRRATARRGPRARDDPVTAVTQIVGNRDQREIERFASLCSENVSLNS